MQKFQDCSQVMKKMKKPKPILGEISKNDENGKKVAYMKVLPQNKKL